MEKGGAVLIKPEDKSKTGPQEGRAWDKLGLEEIVHIANKVGLAYVDAKKNAEYFDLLKPTIRARVALRLDNGDLSEAKLKRLTETDSE